MDKMIIGLDFGDHYAFPCFIEGFDPDAKVGGTVHKLIPPQYNSGIPTVYFYSERKGTLCGYDAVTSRATPPDNRLRYLRRQLGETRTVDGKKISVDEAITEVVRHCVRLANAQLLENFRKTTNLISVAYPVKYSPRQRDRLRELIEKATLEDGTPVRVCNMIAEPAAVALDYLYMHGTALKDTTLLIYDLSTGCFEAAIVEVYPQGHLSADGSKYYYDIIDSCSLNGAGGKEFDQAMFELLLEKAETELGGEELTQRERDSLLGEAEKAKIELSGMDVVNPEVIHDDEILDIEITREEFEEKTKTILRKTIRLVKDLLKAHPDIHPEKVILSGGSCEMPMVESALKKYLKEYSDKIVKHHPELSVAAGAARQGIWETMPMTVSLTENASKPKQGRSGSAKASNAKSAGTRSAKPKSAGEGGVADKKTLSKQQIQDLYSQGEKYYSGKGVVVNYLKAAEYYREAGDLGHAGAQFSLGYCYANGKGVTKDDIKAAEWYRKAAEQGQMEAQYNLGHCYASGKGVTKDDTKAAEWYRKAAEQGHVGAQSNLGYCYYVGQGVKIDFAQAVTWFTKAADQKYAEAQYYLGCCYEHGHGVEKDVFKAAGWYVKAAEQGYAAAQYKAAYGYDYGQGLPRDLSKAINWYQRSANQGNAEAQCRLGYCYYYGRGVSANFIQSAEWYQKAAEQGNAEAQYRFAYCYEYGKGVTQDKTKSFEWYHKAADQGHIEAQCNLGYCYSQGNGVKQNAQMAVEWYRKAAEQGNARAQNNLACCYDQGRGVTRDYVQAAKWFRKSAEQGYVSAQYSLGLCYEEGDGVATNESQALYWYKKASKQVHEESKKRVKKLKIKNSIFTVFSLISLILFLFVWNGGSFAEKFWSIMPLGLGKSTGIPGFGYSMIIFTVLTVLTYLLANIVLWSNFSDKEASGFKAKMFVLLFSIGMWYAGYGLTHVAVKITWGYYVFATLIAIVAGAAMGFVILISCFIFDSDGNASALFRDRCAKFDVRFITSMIFCHIGFCGFYALKNGMNIEDTLINKIILGLLLIGGALFSVFYAVKRIIVACPKYANRNDKQRKRTSEIAIFVLTIALTVAFFLTNYTLELFAENETLRMLIYPCTFTLPFVLFFRFVAIGVMNKQVKK